ncbi:MAG TPA: alanyl-tRNA editing protein, partial [Herpetosiphonaceae bacterium]|nr:alanyl-tRNA editing protein [Herpetosiphonaceae bacterium]
MSERLYWQDAYLRGWTARVVASRADERGGAVQLDRTAFYPEGGGQPADRGAINGVAVLDVQLDEDDGIWHILAGPLEAGAAECALDWPRRFDHMQQHHGQHLLSAAFEATSGARTVAFHLGADSVTIDLDAAVDAEQLAAAEDLANEVVWADEPVLARFVSPEELAGIRLRKPPSVTGAIRVVSAGDFDHSACGGTHPRSTGGVGLIHIRRTERRGAGTRVEFVCGGRALRDLRWKNAALGRIAASFSGSPEQAEEAIGRLREAEAAARKALQEAQAQLLTLEARELVA